MLKRLRRQISRRWPDQPPASRSGREERMAFAAEVPLGPDTPLCRVQVQMITEPHADGERTRLRAHIQTNFASVLKPALTRAPTERPALPTSRATPASALVQRASGLAQRAAQRALGLPGVRSLAAPLMDVDLNTWFEIQTSTASLAEGAHELLPQAERLAAHGIMPRKTEDQPMAESWAGQTPEGYAQVSVLQMDKRHLPERLRDLLGDGPFSLAATIVNTARQK